MRLLTLEMVVTFVSIRIITLKGVRVILAVENGASSVTRDLTRRRCVLSKVMEKLKEKHTIMTCTIYR